MKCYFKRVISGVVAVAFAVFQTTVLALPTGGSVTSGSATIGTSGNMMTINQSSAKAIIDYQTFNIALPETVKFNQPDVNSATLNRVAVGNPSVIMGKIQANGHVFLINPSGMLFGSTAQVNVGSLVASTLDISNSDFLNGNYDFVGGGAHIVNQGILSAPGGYIALLSNQITNSGVITAQLGEVALAAGEAITLNLDSTGLVSVDVTDKVNTNPNGLKDGILNVGEIKANGGTVLLTAKVLNSVFDNAINTEGIVEATTLTNLEGKIVLEGNVDVLVGGEVTGGDIDFISTKGNIIHKVGSQVTTDGGDFYGDAYGDYVFGNGSLVDTGDGIIDVLSQTGNILIGTDADDKYLDYEWEILSSGHRNYKFLEFGFYYDSPAGKIYIPFTKGSDLGKDGVSTLSGSGILNGVSDVDIYTLFRNGSILLYWHEIIGDNSDGKNHIQKAEDFPSLASKLGGIDLQDVYGWEDVKNLGDKDYNDAVVRFSLNEETYAKGATIRSNTDIMMQSDNGYIEQKGGDIIADNLGLYSDKGVSGYGSNNSLLTTVNNVGAVNKSSGDILIENTIDLAVAELALLNSRLDKALLMDGVDNQAVGGKVDILVPQGELVIDTYVQTHSGDIDLEADNITLEEDSYVKINYQPAQWLEIINLKSTSHATSTWSNDDSVDFEWQVAAFSNSPLADIMMKADDAITMKNSSYVKSNGGDITLNAGDDITLTLLDAGFGKVSVASDNGDIIDGDLSTVPTDYDVIALVAELNAPNGVVGGVSPSEIDIKAPDVSFSNDFVRSASPDTVSPDNTPDAFSTALNGSGEWVFGTTRTANEDGADWSFHVKAVEPLTYIPLSETKHLYPFFLDMTAPTIVASRDVGPNVYGWNNTDVTVSYTVNDNLSGVDNLNAGTDYSDDTVTTEGVNQWTQGVVYDKAGNMATVVESPINIDKTAPTIVADRDVDPNVNGWNNTDVTVSYVVNDNLSGTELSGGVLGSDYNPDTVTTEGIGQSTSGIVYDKAGNVASIVEGLINIDKTAPTITATRDVAPNTYGWNNTDVTVSYNVSDGLSGIDNAHAQTDYSADTVTTEGVGQSTSGSVVDKAGNVAVKVESPINIDKTAPIIFVQSENGTQNPDGSYEPDVEVELGATDNLSGFDPSGSLSTNLPDDITFGLGDSGLTITSDGVFDRAGNFAPGIPVGPYTIISPLSSLGIEDFNDQFLVYYEILNPSSFLSFEPVTKMGVYAYHPLTPTDSSAFDGIELEEEAYEFIEDQINLKEDLDPFFGQL